ncbi:MAG: DNA-processing protein DprA [Spirochaetia bacterium]|nr:DNA-processing protein DprA [Spirochaetia bacterium]
MKEEEKYVRLCISLLPGLTCKEKWEVEKSINYERSFINLHTEDISKIIRRNYRSKRFFPEEILTEADEILITVQKRGYHFIHFLDTAYPPQLREIYNPPYLLYAWGELYEQSKPSISIVGTRRSTEKADIAAFGMGLECAYSGIPVVSGLAAGIDSASHSGAVRADGISIAVMGSGLNHIYPQCNRKLAERMVDRGGCILSEFIPEEKPLRYNFPKRNRIISGLSRSTIVIQAPEKSGSLITADYALEQGRDVFIHKTGTSHRFYNGTKRLAEEGAPVISSIKEVFENWAWNLEKYRQVTYHYPAEMKQSELIKKEIKGEIIRYRRGWFERNS